MIIQQVSQARREFSDLLNRVIYQQERVILERHTKPIAAILPMAEYERFRAILAGEHPAVIPHSEDQDT